MNKITYLYGHTFFPYDDKTNAFIYRPKYFNHRDQLVRDELYYMNCLRMNVNSTEVDKFYIGIEYAPPSYFVKDKCENSLIMNFVIKGQGTVNGKLFSAGDFYYIEPLKKSTLAAIPNDPWVTVFIMLIGSHAEKLLNLFRSKSGGNILKLKNPIDVLKISETIIYSLDCSLFSEEYVKSLLNILTSYITNNPDETDLPSGLLSKPEQIVNSVKRSVNKKLATVTVASLSEELHYERRYLTHVFSAVTGITPQEYIINCKMDWAKTALSQTTLSINEITETLGYEHRNGFIIAFQKKYGCSPSAYRQLAKETIAENRKLQDL